jgi:hypothetical protein
MDPHVILVQFSGDCFWYALKGEIAPSVDFYRCQRLSLLERN